MEFIKKNRLLYWTIEILLLSILILVLSSLSFIFEPIGIFVRTIFIPIIAAGFLYYLLHPVVALLEKRFKLKHILAVVLTFAVFLIVIASVFITFVPQLIEQISNLLGTLPNFANSVRKNVNGWLRSTWFRQFGWQIKSNDFQQQISKYSSTFLRASLSSLGSALSFLTTFTINVITIPIMLFYMLADGDRFVPFVNRFIFPSRAGEVNDLAARMNNTIGRYIGGQFIEALFVMICVTTGYLIIHQPFAPLLGLFAGLCVLIPYVGPFIGMVPSLLIAITISTQQVLAVLLVVVVVSQLDGNLIYPNVIGRNLKIHPMTIIIILLSAGNIWGLPGMILGVPIYAIIRTIVIFVYNIYQLKKDEQNVTGSHAAGTTEKLLKKSAHKENKNDA